MREELARWPTELGDRRHQRIGFVKQRMPLARCLPLLA